VGVAMRVGAKCGWAARATVGGIPNDIQAVVSRIRSGPSRKAGKGIVGFRMVGRRDG